MNCRLAFANAALVLATTRIGFAQASALPRGTDDVPRYSIAEPDWQLWQLPSRTAARRGALIEGTAFPVFATATRADCKNPWWQVGANAWLCPDEASVTQVDTRLTAGSNDRVQEAPMLYVAVGKGGALGYKKRENVDVGSPNAEMQPGFMLGVMRASDYGDSTAFLTSHGFWIPARDVQVVKASSFRGTELEGELEVGWVFDKRATLHSAPDKRTQPPAFVERLTQVAVNGQQQKASGLWLKTELGWLKAADVRVPQLQLPPPEITSDEHWIDVDTQSQTLVAYVGSRPVFATLVSTGRGKPGTEQATPIGVRRLWIKLRRSDMDNLDDAETQSPYAVEAVPDVMFFDRGYGIHGTYWHDRFGTPKSHGCVNVSLNDARWLFEFTGPHLPVGWSAVFPTNTERGTLVRVR